MRLPRFALPLGLLALALAGIAAMHAAPYGGNASALFHLDEVTNDEHAVPAGFVVLTVPGYDGEQYYEMARTMPLLFTAEGRAQLGRNQNRSYAYQRFLLPVTAFVLSLGMEPLLPAVFVIINIGALLLSAWIVLRWRPKAWLYAAAIALSPAAMVALHFNLAEPLTILLITFFLTRYADRKRIDGLDLLLLSLLMLSREVNIFFVGFLVLWTLAKRHWRDLLLLAVPIAVFAAFHGLIYYVFGALPFLTSLGKSTYPFGAVIELVLGGRGYNRLTLSSIALVALFFLPAIGWIAATVARERRITMLQLGSVLFLLLMSMTSWYIWGSITSIGRVITPVYPLVLLEAAHRDTLPARCIALGCMAVGLAAAVALALIGHPYRIA